MTKYLPLLAALSLLAPSATFARDDAKPRGNDGKHDARERGTVQWTPKAPASPKPAKPAPKPDDRGRGGHGKDDPARHH